MEVLQPSESHSHLGVSRLYVLAPSECLTESGEVPNLHLLELSYVESGIP